MPPALQPENPRASAEDAIASAKQQLEGMIDLIPQSMLLVNRDGSVARANRSLLRLLSLQGFPDALGRSLPALFPSADPTAFDRLLSVETGYRVSDVTCRLADGRDHILRFTALGLGASRDLHMLLVDDVTAAAEREEEEMRRIKRDAVLALMGSLMHNINQPLTVIMVRARLSVLEMDKEKPDLEELRRNLREIMDFTLQASERLTLFERPKDFVTEGYVGGIEILDIDRSR